MFAAWPAPGFGQPRNFTVNRAATVMIFINTIRIVAVKLIGLTSFRFTDWEPGTIIPGLSPFEALVLRRPNRFHNPLLRREQARDRGLANV